MKVVRCPQPEKRGPRRPQRLRQDAAALDTAVRCRRRQSTRAGRRRHGGHGLRRRSDRPQAHPLLRPRLRRVEQDQDQLHRHAGDGQLPQRCARRAAGCRRGGSGRRRRRRRRGLDREDVEPPPTNSGCPRLDRPQPARSRARQPRAVGRVAASGVRPRGDADSAADWRREGVPRRGRPRVHEGVDLAGGRERQAER